MLNEREHGTLTSRRLAAFIRSPCLAFSFAINPVAIFLSFFSLASDLFVVAVAACFLRCCHAFIYPLAYRATLLILILDQCVLCRRDQPRVDMGFLSID